MSITTTEADGTGLLTIAAEQAMERMDDVGEVGTKVSRAVHRVVLQGGEPARRVADVLHGTWLGHPLHVVLTDFAIGAWAAGAVFDGIGQAQDSPSARDAGDRLAQLGTVLAVPTALSGLADFSTVPKPAATSATLHGLLNGTVFGLYLLSLRDRHNGRRSRGLGFSMFAQGLILASAWLGGHLVYRHRMGVDRSDRFSGPEEWTPVLDETELRENEPRRVPFDGQDVLLYREGDEVYAIGAVCNHAGGPLDEGQFRDGCVECPWHQSVFNLRNGRVVHGPATHPQPAFAARLHAGKVEIRLLHG